MAVKNLETVRSDFCYISTLLHIVFFSGQCGFNMALLVMLIDDQPIEYIAFTLWLVFEGFLMIMASTLLLYGMYKRIHECLIVWLIIALLCLVCYVTCTVFEVIAIPDAKFSYFAQLNTRFSFRRLDIIGIVWRVYLILTIGIICWLHKDLKKNESVTN